MTTIGNPVTLPEGVTPESPRQVKSGGTGEIPQKQKAALKQVTREFEALFVGLMLKSMRSTVATDSLTGGGRGEEVYRSLLDQEYAMEIARGEGLGLGTMLEEQLARYIGNSETNETRTKP
ncbi:MAG TPA: rod-binding protein [Geobacteraceae bacterium]|nr:rod-binding protein [Geobacteraceae bacterium]